MKIMRDNKTRLVLLALGGVFAGCGSSNNSPAGSTAAAPTANSDQRRILATVDALQAASHKGDGESICGHLFTASLVRSIERASKRSCPQEVRQHLFSRNEEISVSRDIRVSAAGASAVIREQNGNVSTLFFVKQGSGWRITRVTPKAQG
jgi:hypothetical protein